MRQLLHNCGFKRGIALIALALACTSLGGCGGQERHACTLHGFTEATGSPYRAGSYPTSLTVADFNGDERPDLAVAGGSSSDVTVFLARPRGKFNRAPGSPLKIHAAQPPSPSTAEGRLHAWIIRTGIPEIPPGPSSIVATDFNGDGHQDLAVASRSEGEVTVLLGNGRGRFETAPGSPFSAGQFLRSIVSADFDGNGRADLAVGGSSETSFFRFFAGAGSGRFKPAGPTRLGNQGSGVISVADFNHDGRPDIVLDDDFGGGVRIFLGDGKFGFSSSSGTSAGEMPSAASGDFNGDGRLDLVTTSLAGYYSVAPGDGKGGIESPAPFRSAGGFPSSVTAGDVNDDGHPDLVLAESSKDQLTVLINDGRGKFKRAPAGPFATGSDPSQVVIADFDLDGHSDLATVNYESSDVSVLLARCD